MPHKVIAIDPGTDISAFVLMLDGKPTNAGISSNIDIAGMLADNTQTDLAIEMIASYGMPVGREVFETCVWLGRFIEAHGGTHEKVYRKDVKMHLCGTPRAKDANIRQALIDRFGPGKELAIGKKATPGPLYQYKSHMWAALAVGITYYDKQQGMV